MFLPVAIVYRNGNRILRDQYSYLRNDLLVNRKENFIDSMW